VTAGAHAGGKVELDLRRLYIKRIQIIGDGSELPNGIERTFALAAAGKLRGVVDQVLPLEAAAEAHRLVAAREGVGKVLLSPQAG
jgi:NADPH2:quinone reductase